MSGAGQPRSEAGGGREFRVEPLESGEAVLELESYDWEIYDQEAELEALEEAAGGVCGIDEVKRFIVELLSELSRRTVEVGVRIMVDAEPTLHESALAALSLASTCFPSVADGVYVKTPDGRRLGVSLTFGGYMPPARRGASEVNVMIYDYDSSSPDAYKVVSDIVNEAARNPLVVYLIVVKSPKENPFTTASVVRGLVEAAMRRVLPREKLAFLGRLPYDLVLTAPVERLREAAASWEPPPPNFSEPMRKPGAERGLEGLVLPPELRELLARLVEVWRLRSEREGGSLGSVAVIGLPGSGRKTILAAVARELRWPAYIANLYAMISKWVGESEKNLKSLFESARGRGRLVLVMEGAESMFRSYEQAQGNETMNNLRNLFFQEVTRDDNTFLLGFTLQEDVPRSMLDTPLTGEYKIVVPPPGEEERRRLARLYVRMVAGDRWQQLLKVASQAPLARRGSPEEFVYRLWADAIAEYTVGLGAGEIYRLTVNVVEPAVSRALAKGRLPSIVEEVARTAARDYSARKAKLAVLRKVAVSIGQSSIAEAIMRVENELSRRMEMDEKTRELMKPY